MAAIQTENFREVTTFPDGEYVVELLSLSTEQKEEVYLTWFFQTSTELLPIKYSYSARSNRELTKHNFAIIGITKDSLPTVIFSPEVLKGRKAILLVNDKEISFTKCLSLEPIYVENVEIPF